MESEKEKEKTGDQDLAVQHEQQQTALKTAQKDAASTTKSNASGVSTQVQGNPR